MRPTALLPIVALALGAVVSHAAPAPVFKPLPAQDPIVSLLARLKKEGKAGLPGGWEVTAERVVGDRLVKPVLTRKDDGGRIVFVMKAAEAEVGPYQRKGEVSFRMVNGSAVGPCLDMTYASKMATLELPIQR